jgi:hypothetical protein
MSMTFFSYWYRASELHSWVRHVCSFNAKLWIFYQTSSKFLRCYCLFLSVSIVHVFVGLEGGYRTFYVLARSIGALLRRWSVGRIFRALWWPLLRRSSCSSSGRVPHNVHLRYFLLVAHFHRCCAQYVVSTCRLRCVGKGFWSFLYFLLLSEGARLREQHRQCYRQTRNTGVLQVHFFLTLPFPSPTVSFILGS